MNNRPQKKQRTGITPTIYICEWHVPEEFCVCVRRETKVYSSDSTKVKNYQTALSPHHGCMGWADVQ